LATNERKKQQRNSKWAPEMISNSVRKDDLQMISPQRVGSVDKEEKCFGESEVENLHLAVRR
jgi:hypothetical protein